MLRRDRTNPFAELDQLNESDKPSLNAAGTAGKPRNDNDNKATRRSSSTGQPQTRRRSSSGAGTSLSPLNGNGNGTSSNNNNNHSQTSVGYQRHQLLGALTTDISTNNWDYARKTFRRNTNAVSTEVDSDGNTPLHWIMKAADAPLDFAELVLASYPEAAAVQEKVRGLTPLHVACEQYKVGEGGKIEMLLDLAGHGGVATTRDHLGRLPLDIFLKQLDVHRVKLSFPPRRVLSLFPEFLALWTATYGACVAAAAMKDWDAVKQLLRSKVEGPMQKVRVRVASGEWRVASGEWRVASAGAGAGASARKSSSPTTTTTIASLSPIALHTSVLVCCCSQTNKRTPTHTQNKPTTGLLRHDRH